MRKRRAMKLGIPALMITGLNRVAQSPVGCEREATPFVARLALGQHQRASVIFGSCAGLFVPGLHGGQAEVGAGRETAGENFASAPEFRDLGCFSVAAARAGEIAEVRAVGLAL